MTQSLCVDVFIQPGLHFHIETWLNKLITVKLYDVRKRLRCEEDFKDVVTGFVHGISAFVIQLRNQLMEKFCMQQKRRQ